MIKYPNDRFFKSLDKELQNLCRLLDKILDEEVIATSGLRSLEDNVRVGGVINSSHLNGKAIDIDTSNGKTRYKVLFGAIAAGFKRIGIAKDHIHLDCDQSKPFPTVWLE